MRKVRKDAKTLEDVEQNPEVTKHKMEVQEGYVKPTLLE